LNVTIGCLHALYVVLGVLILWIALRAVAAGRLRLPIVFLLGASVLLLFLFNELELRTLRFQLASGREILTAIGFSYVSLRVVEILRAVADGRHPLPGIFSLINYLLPFRMLAAGPIQSIDHFMTQPAVPAAPTSLDVLRGSERVALGLFKKFVLATAIDEIFLNDFNDVGLSTLLEVQFFFSGFTSISAPIPISPSDSGDSWASTNRRTSTART